MTSAPEAYSLLAELSLGLLGFSGVAAAFGGRDRVFRGSEFARLQGVFRHSGIALAGCLLVLSLFEAGVAAAKTFSIVSAVCGLSYLVFVFPVVPAGYRASREADSTTGIWFLHSMTVYFTALVCLYFANAALGGHSWPVVLAMASQLLFSLLNFYRFLVRPN